MAHADHAGQGCVTAPPTTSASCCTNVCNARSASTRGSWWSGSVASSRGKVLAHTQLPQEAFIAFVRGTNRAMPPFSEKLVSDGDLIDIYAYLQSVPKAKDPKSITLLNP